MRTALFAATALLGFAANSLLCRLALRSGEIDAARGVALAAASGGLASGVGYSLWYAAVPALGATRAAAIQLAVPVLTAIAGIALLGESLRIALAIGGSAIVLGLALALTTQSRRAADR